MNNKDNLLKSYIPPFLYEDKNFNSLYKNQETELEILYENLDDIVKQLIVDTATWGLTIYEKIYGIDTDLSLSYDQRREIIKARMRGQGTCTRDLIKQVVSAFSNGQCEVIENTAPYTFSIKFTSIYGVPKNMDGLRKAIDDIKPAHLVYDFIYKYLTWDNSDKENISFNELDYFTWDDWETANLDTLELVTDEKDTIMNEEDETIVIERMGLNGSNTN